MSQPSLPPYILGIDLGANSLGWAAVAVDEQGEPTGFLQPPIEIRKNPTLGIRIFEEGVENYGQGEREAGRGQKRRMMRLQRRQALRRARRQAKTFRILRLAGLLPDPLPEDGAGTRPRSLVRDAILKRLDVALAGSLAAKEPDAARQALVREHVPYALRAQALDRALTRHELGRAFYHLAQRRGFLSNRKASDPEDERGKVKTGISELQEAMRSQGSRTLGEHLLAQAARGERLRRRWTARDMYRTEFEAIWSAQEPHHREVLTAELKKRLFRALFFQRPLKSQRNLIGLCEFENGDEYVFPGTGDVHATKRRRRAPEGLLISQRFRLLQKVNDLEILDPAIGSRRRLSPAERESLVRGLDEAEEMTFRKIKERLELPRTTKFNLEAEGTRKLLGNRTNAQILRIFGDRWRGLDPGQREQAVMEIWSATDDSALVRRARGQRGVWGTLRTTPDEAEGLAEVRIGSEYMALSRHAMATIVPWLEQGLQYSEAALKAYGERIRREALGSLPPVERALGSLRNPAVSRALTELRRVVNLLVRRYGKPKEIHIELARDLKRSKDERSRILKSNREREEEREKAAQRIIAEAGIPEPKGGDVLKVRLWQECNGVCPYSGRSIGFKQLFGHDVDVEHILPLSTSLDDSYLNKTLCFADENRQRKKNRTPHEAFGSDPERWEAMVQRMKRNVEEHGMPRAKLERFHLAGKEYHEFLDKFRSSQLNDTRYASARAKEYVALLYGGNVVQGTDEDGKRRVYVSNGQATAIVREALGLDWILKRTYGVEKRADHRHHAVDALVVALTGPSMVQRLAKLAEQREGRRREVFRDLPTPWFGFEDQVQTCLDEVAVSHRIDNRVRGPLHKETIYTARRAADGKPDPQGDHSHVRVVLDKRTKRSDLDAVVDPKVRGIVQEFFDDPEKLRGFDPSRPESAPQLLTKDGRRIPILRVRIRKRNTTTPVGDGHRSRFVETSENHHLLIRKSVSSGGREQFRYEIVSALEAARRKKERTPIYQRDETTVVLVRRNDVLELAVGGTPRLCKVRGVNEQVIQVCPLNDARQKEEQVRDGAFLRISPSRYRSDVSRKLAVSPIGVVHPCRA